jgi:hypothetical protein
LVWVHHNSCGSDDKVWSALILDYKQNQLQFLMKPRQWVTFQGTISGVEMIVIAQRGVSYMLSTCGSTAPAEKNYKSYFEDDYSNVGSKQISCL